MLNNFGQKWIRAGCRSGELAVIVSKGLDHQARSNVHGIYFLFRDGYRPSSEDIYRFISQSPGTSISLDPAERPKLRLVASDDRLVSDGDRANCPDNNRPEPLSEGLTFDLAGLAPAPIPLFR